MDIDLAALDPPPTAMVSNLPYSIATPLCCAQSPSCQGCGWTVMVQREIADRLGAAPRTKAYGSPSVLVQLACRVRLLRAVIRGVPSAAAGGVGARAARPDRPWPGDAVARLVRGAFAHRRKALARWSRHCRRGVARADVGGARGWSLPAAAGAEELAPADFAALAGELGR